MCYLVLAVIDLHKAVNTKVGLSSFEYHIAIDFDMKHIVTLRKYLIHFKGYPFAVLKKLVITSFTVFNC